MNKEQTQTEFEAVCFMHEINMEEERFCPFCGHRVPITEYDPDARMCTNCIQRFDEE